MSAGCHLRWTATALLLGLSGAAACAPHGQEPGGPGKPDASAQSSTRKDTDTVMQAIFDAAVQSHGQAYLDADRKLRAGGIPAEMVLRNNLHHADPVARMLARTTLDWVEGSAKDYQDTLDYLDYLPNRLARTPITVPPPSGVAAYLTLHFEGRVADFLSVRLVKGTDWEYWRVAGVLFYLKEQARPSTTEPLLRFAVETKDDELRGWAIEAITASNDPDLKAKLDVERRRTQALAIPFPAALAALTPAKAP